MITICNKFTAGKLNPLWVIVAFAAVYVPFVLFTPPQYYELFIPTELWIFLRVCMQAAWLAPLLIIWKDGKGTWNGKYFLSGFVIGGGWLIAAQLIVTVIQAFGTDELSLLNTVACIVSYFFLGITSGLYSLTAKSMRQALLFGLLCFVGQSVIFVLVFIKYLFIVVN